ncbi:MAG: hypothetical protein ACRENB_10250, partial [Gemmatimonadales bacterium]
DSADLLVRAPSGAATFTTEADRLVVEHRAAVRFEIQIPRSAPRVEIRSGARRVFLKEGPRAQTEPGSGQGPWLIPLIP